MSTNQVQFRRLTWLTAFTLTGAFIVVFRLSIAANMQLAAAVACLATVGCVIATVRANRRRPICLGSMYAALFGLFHIGLLLPLAVGLPLRLLNPGDDHWANSPGFAAAATLIAVAECAYAIGYLLLREQPPGPPPDLQPSRRSGSDIKAAGWDGPAIVGALLLMAGVGLWTYNAWRSGVSIIGSSYSEFLSRTSTVPTMPIAYLLMGYGPAVVSASSHRTSRQIALAVFAIWAVPAFSLGLRGEVIIPAASYLVVAARRRSIPLRPWMAAALVAGLSAGSTVRVLRQLGIGHGGAALASFNPLDGLTELGYSIRPLAVVSTYHDQLGERSVGIATYVAPFRRLIVGKVLGGDVTPVADDPVVFGAMIVRRVGPIGGSPAAEAYRAGGLIAIVIVMLLIGLLVAAADARRTTPISNCMVGMLAFALLLWVRNDFTPVPGELAVATVVICLVWLFEQRGRSPAKARSPELVGAP